MPEIEAWPSASVASDLNGGPISPSPIVDILTEPIQSCDPSNAENLSQINERFHFLRDGHGLWVKAGGSLYSLEQCQEDHRQGQEISALQLPGLQLRQ